MQNHFIFKKKQKKKKQKWQNEMIISLCLFHAIFISMKIEHIIYNIIHNEHFLLIIIAIIIKYNSMLVILHLHKGTLSQTRAHICINKNLSFFRGKWKISRWRRQKRKVYHFQRTPICKQSPNDIFVYEWWIPKRWNFPLRFRLFSIFLSFLFIYLCVLYFQVFHISFAQHYHHTENGGKKNRKWQSTSVAHPIIYAPLFPIVAVVFSPLAEIAFSIKSNRTKNIFFLHSFCGEEKKRLRINNCQWFLFNVNIYISIMRL